MCSTRPFRSAPVEARGSPIAASSRLGHESLRQSLLTLLPTQNRANARQKNVQSIQIGAHDRGALLVALLPLLSVLLLLLVIPFPAYRYAADKADVSVGPPSAPTDRWMSAFYSWPARSRSLLPDLRQAFQAYILWTKGEGQPALPLFIGFFIVGFYLIRPLSDDRHAGLR